MIAEQIKKLRLQIPEHVKIIAVSKTRTIEEIKEAIDAGQLDFGENRVQELVAKQPYLPEFIRWHFIGHLQTNKVKQIIPLAEMIQSVDSPKLLFEINKEAAKINQKVSCLLEFHIAKEETKHGFDLDGVKNLLNSDDYRKCKNIHIKGVMGMATFTNDLHQIRNEFRKLHEYFIFLKDNYFASDDSFREISMGMSNDYMIAIEEGSTMVRIGTTIFGERKSN